MNRVVTLLFLGLISGCGSAEVETPAAAPTEEAAVDKHSPEALAAVADQLVAEPDRSEAILKENGWTAEAFEAALVGLAKDGAKRKAYVEARKK